MKIFHSSKELFKMAGGEMHFPHPPLLESATETVFRPGFLNMRIIPC